MGKSRTTTTPPVLRLAHPLAFTAFLRHIGAPAGRHLRAQGLPELCEDPDALVPLRNAWAFFDATARSEDPLLGWHVGRFVRHTILNRNFLSKVEREPTLLQALQRLIRMSYLEASHLKLGIRERSDDVLVFTHYAMMKASPGYHSSQAYQIGGVILSLIRHFAGANWMPHEIGIEQSVVAPGLQDLFPGTRLLGGQQVGFIAIPRFCLGAPPPAPSEESGQELRPLAGPLDYVGTLRALIKPHLSSGHLSEAIAARLMDTSARTLRRRLSTHRTSYRRVLEEVRFLEAVRLLEDTSERIIDVAGNVGFDDPAHFTRMFRRVSGRSPREFRKGLG